MPDSDLPVPFLAAFFERRVSGDGALARAGTQTFTKARESGDVDEAPMPRQAAVRALALGTETITETRREDVDVDEPRQGSTAAYGTQTGTATREEPDTDDMIRANIPASARSAALLGTETGSRSREDPDRDEGRPGAKASLWQASVL